MAEFSRPRQDAFSQKMIDILNAGALNLALAIGYRTGLFEVMARLDHPQTVEGIADVSELNRRYIREWLGVMISGGVVEASRDADGQTRFFLPREHAACLTRAEGNANLAVYTQEIPLLTTCALEGVIDGFRTGQGVPYRCYPKFQAFMSELSNAKHRQVLVDRFLPAVDGGRLLDRLNQGIRVCDLGCGEGVALLLMAQAFPRSRFVGIDICPDSLQVARNEADRRGLTNVDFQLRDAAALDREPGLAGTFDYVMAFDAIHDQTAPLDALRGVRHILAPGGLFSMVDIAARTELIDNMNHPMGPFLYTVSLMHCMPVGLVDGGMGLGMMWGREKAVDMLREGGFDRVEVVEMEDDPFNLHFLCRT